MWIHITGYFFPAPLNQRFLTLQGGGGRVGKGRLAAPLNKLMKTRGILPPKMRTHDVYVYKYMCKYLYKCEDICMYVHSIYI